MGAEPAVALDFEARDERPRARAREKTVMVSARIPESTYLRVKDILLKLGKSQTDLIFAAFEYTSLTGELPRDSRGDQRARHGRSLSPEELERFRNHMREITIGRSQSNPEHDDRDFDRLKFEVMKERFPEHLGHLEYEDTI